MITKNINQIAAQYDRIWKLHFGYDKGTGCMLTLYGRLLSAESRPQLKAEQPALFRLQRYGNLCRHTT